MLCFAEEGSLHLLALCDLHLWDLLWVPCMVSQLCMSRTEAQ